MCPCDVIDAVVFDGGVDQQTAMLCRRIGCIGRSEEGSKAVQAESGS